MNPYDQTECPLCGRELTRENCRWTEFPGVCTDCVPAGVLIRVKRGFVPRGRKAPRPPKGMKRIRWCKACGYEFVGRQRVCPVCSKRRHCACGAVIARRLRMCAACAKAARRKRARDGMRRLRARQEATPA